MIQYLVLAITSNLKKQKVFSYLWCVRNSRFVRLNHLFKSMLLSLLLVFSSVSMSKNPTNKEVYLGDPEKGKQTAAGICAGCHAIDGNSIIPTNPILAGQHAAYISKQLHNFQVKAGDEKAMRENAVMVVFASALSDEEIEDLASYYSQQKISPSYAKNIDLAKVGESLYKGGDIDNGIPSCSSCHGPRGAGIPDQYPRVGGQYFEYTKTTLLSFKKGIRANNKQMMSIAGRMTEEQINAVSEYLAGLR